jgi:hypothetical protein
LYKLLFGGTSKSPLIQHKPKFHQIHTTRFFTLTFPLLHLPRSAGDPSSAPSLTRARHAGDAGGGQARALSDGVSVFPSHLSAVASRPRLRSSTHQPATLRSSLSLSLLPPPVDHQRRSAAPRAACGQLEPAAAAPPRRSRRFGSACAPKRIVNRPISAGFWNPASDAPYYNS